MLYQRLRYTKRKKSIQNIAFGKVLFNRSRHKNYKLIHKSLYFIKVKDNAALNIQNLNIKNV